MQHTDQELFNHLMALRLRYTAENLENLTASLSGRTPREILSHITAIELAEQKNRSIARRLAAAGIGRYKRMEDFDWKHPLEINRAKIENLFLNDFTKLGKNLVIIGTQGLGKTMIARNLAAKAVYNGHTARFITASKICSDLLCAGHRLESRLRYYANVDLLVIG